MSEKEVKLTKYYDDRGEEVQLSPEIVKKYLVSGKPDQVTHQEITMFLALCKYQKLNPFLREAYLIKFAGSPATIVTGKDVWTKRASRNPDCTGWSSGVIVQSNDTGNIIERDGSMVLKSEMLIGGWGKVYRRSWSVPIYVTVSMDEYNKNQANWKTMPGTMIRKVGLVQALREAFPEDFEGLYSPEEMGVDASAIDNKPMEATILGAPDNNVDSPDDIEIDDEPEPEKEETIDTAQVKELFKTAKGNKDIVRDVVKKAGYKKASDVTVVAFEGIKAEIEEAHAKKHEKEEPEPEPEEEEGIEGIDAEIDPDGQLNFEE